MNWRFRFRVASLLFSATLRLAREDPAGFAAKVSERIRSSGNKMLAAVPVSLLTRRLIPVDEARDLINVGQLSQGIRLIDHQGRLAGKAGRYLAERTRERLEQLSTAPPVTVDYATQVAEPRVLHYLTSSILYTQSGYTLRSHDALKAQQKAGINVRAVTRTAYPVIIGRLPGSPERVFEGIEYRSLLPKTYSLSSVERDEESVEMLVKQAKMFNATVLHTTTDFKNAIVVSRAAHRLGIPWVYEIRGELESTWLSKQPAQLRDQAALSEFYQLARAQETAYAKTAAAVVTLSEIVKEQFVARGVDQHRIHVIPNAIDEAFVGKDFNQANIRIELGLPNTILVGTVTSVVGYEGLDTLIRSLAFLSADVQVIIVGDGAARPELEKLSRELGLLPRVHFVGKKRSDEIWKWYAALDVFVVPRRDLQVCRVVTPLKSLMAQALGVPVVASDLPALREVTGGRAEYVEPESPSALATGISRQLQGSLSDLEAADWISSRTWAANSNRYLDVYRDL